MHLTSPMNYTQHPLSALFPAKSAEDFQTLKDSIDNIGVQNPVTLYEGMVIDGWHRYTAATELGILCPTVELKDVDPRDFVLAQNKARRHCTTAQLIAAASEIYRWRPNGGYHSALSAECFSSKQIAEKVGISVRTVDQFRKVERDAVSEVKDAVKRGDIGLSKAEAIAKLPADKQVEAIKNPSPKVRRSMTEMGATSALKLTSDKTEADKLAEEAFGDTDVIALLEETEAECVKLRALVAAAEEDDQKAATIKWKRIADIAQRRQCELMDTVHQRECEMKRLMNIVRGVCEAVGTEDQTKVLSMVKSLVKSCSEAVA